MEILNQNISLQLKLKLRELNLPTVSLIVHCMKSAIGALQASKDAYCLTSDIGMLPMVEQLNNKPYLNRSKLNRKQLNGYFQRHLDVNFGCL
ncbi:hypothetical protein D3C72_1978560 [compost metagenome]